VHGYRILIAEDDVAAAQEILAIEPLDPPVRRVRRVRRRRR
jgi:hypothetical protein